MRFASLVALVSGYLSSTFLSQTFTVCFFPRLSRALQLFSKELARLSASCVAAFFAGASVGTRKGLGSGLDYGLFC